MSLLPRRRSGASARTSTRRSAVAGAMPSSGASPEVAADGGGRRRPRSSTTPSTPTHPTNVRRASSTCGERRPRSASSWSLGVAGLYVPGPRACPAPSRLSVARADRGNQPVGGSQSPRGIATDVDMERLTLPLPARGIWLRVRSLLSLAFDRCTVQFSTGKLDLSALDPTPGERPRRSARRRRAGCRAEQCPDPLRKAAGSEP